MFLGKTPALYLSGRMRRLGALTSAESRVRPAQCPGAQAWAHSPSAISCPQPLTESRSPLPQERVCPIRATPGVHTHHDHRGSPQAPALEGTMWFNNNSCSRWVLTHFTGGETETQRRQVTRPKSLNSPECSVEANIPA